MFGIDLMVLIAALALLPIALLPLYSGCASAPDLTIVEAPDDPAEPPDDDRVDPDPPDASEDQDGELETPLPVIFAVSLSFRGSAVAALHPDVDAVERADVELTILNGSSPVTETVLLQEVEADGDLFAVQFEPLTVEPELLPLGADNFYELEARIDCRVLRSDAPDREQPLLRTDAENCGQRIGMGASQPYVFDLVHMPSGRSPEQDILLTCA